MGLRTILSAVVTSGLLLGILTTPSAGAHAHAGADADAAGTPGLARSAQAARADDPPRRGADFPRMPGRCYESDDRTLKDRPCRITRYGAKRPMLVVWGDSHAWMYLPALRQEARAARVNLTLVVFGSCPPSLPLPRSRGFGRVQCEKHNTATFDWIKRLTSRREQVSLLVGGFWSGYRQAYRRQQRADRDGTDSGLTIYQQHMSVLAVESSPRLFEKLGRRRLDIDLIGQAATVPQDPRYCPAGREPYQCDLPRARAMDREKGNRRWIKRNLRAPLVGRPRLIDTTPAYCSSQTCRAHVGGANTFYDDVHLGAELTRTLGEYFVPTFDDLR